MIRTKSLRPARAGLALVILSLGGCDGSVGVRRWQSFDFEGFKQALAEPDGPLEPEQLPPVVESIQEVREVVQTFNAAIVRVREAADALAEAGAPLDPDAGFRSDEYINGTNLFATVACPGPNLLNPDTEFNHGRLWIESPGMLLEAAVKWEMKDDILLSAQRCRIGPYLLDGESPAWRDAATDEIAVSLDFEIERVATGEIVEFGLPILYADGEINVLLELAQGSYTVGLDPNGGVVISVRGADSLFACDFSVFPPACVKQ